jgi:SAM-dependent methyltransferase
MAFLTSGLLRRVALPLRASNPGLYDSLNRVRKSVLTRGRDLDAYQGVAFDRFARRVPIEGRRILEIGSDGDLKLLRQMLARGARAAVGVNNDPDLAVTARDLASGPARLLRADATALPFPDGSFDAVFSVATFEHILDLPAALLELHRVLVPGGVVHTNFGPIWSSGKGHHLRVRVGEQRAWHGNPKLNPLPDFCHLLLDPDQLRAALQSRVSAQLHEPIVEWVYANRGINRMFHHEYLDAFDRSPFEIESVVPERDPVSPQLLRILQFAYPKEQAFDVTNTEVILVKGR